MHAFNARPLAIGIVKHRRLLALARGAECLHPLPWLERYAAPRLACAPAAARTDFTIRGGELHLDHLSVLGIACRSPTRTRVPLGTVDYLRCPINGKVR